MNTKQIKSNTSRTTGIWLFLVLLTLLTYALGKPQFSDLEILPIILLAAFLKGHWIIADFMALKQVDRKWRWLVHGWLLVTIGLIALTYY